MSTLPTCTDKLKRKCLMTVPQSGALSDRGVAFPYSTKDCATGCVDEPQAHLKRPQRGFNSSRDFPRLCCNNVIADRAPIAQCRDGVLNPQAYKAAAGFCEATPYKNGSVLPNWRLFDSGVCNKSYTTQDARLFDSARTMQLYLDAKPYDGSVWMDDVYNPAFVPPGYNKQYGSYEDIVGGQIRYYIDKDVAPAFRKQIYNLDGETAIDMFRTPMDKVEPTFYNVPYQFTHDNLSKDTFARDQLFFRNDLTALQQRGHNKQRFEAVK